MNRLSKQSFNSIAFWGCLVTISACGGGGDSSTNPPIEPPLINTDVISPTGMIVFPPEHSITEASFVLIRGTANDNKAVVSVTVNGISAISENNFEQWNAEVTLDNGTNTLSVVILDAAGNENVDSIGIDIKREAFLQSPTAITINQQNNTAVVIDSSKIISIDLDTGKRSTLFQHPEFPQTKMIDVEIDIDNQKIYTFDTNTAYFEEFDIFSGEIRTIPDNNFSTNLSLVFNEDFVLDVINNRVLSVDLLNASVISVDIASGGKTVLFDNLDYTLPTGTIRGIDYNSATNSLFMTEFNWDEGNAIIKIDLNTKTLSRIASNIRKSSVLSDLKLDITNNRALMTETSLSSSSVIVAVDLTTGNVTELSNRDISINDLLSKPQALTLDSENQRLLVIDAKTEALISVDIESGEQSIVSNSEHTIPNADNRLTSPEDMILDKANNRVLVIEKKLGLIAIDLTNGQRTILSDAKNASLGLTLVHAPVDSEFDKSNNRVLVLDSKHRSIVAIDIISGQRTLAYNGNFNDASNLLVEPSSMTFDSEANVAYIEDKSAQNIVAVNLNNNEQNLIAQYPESNAYSSDLALDKINNKLYLSSAYTDNALSSIDIGNNNVQQISRLEGYSDMVLDLDNNRAFVLGESGLFSYDLTTQEKTSVVIPDYVSGGFVQGNALVLDLEDNRIFILNKSAGTLYYIDLTSGQAVIISG